jgi:hypothetical protein
LCQIGPQGPGNGLDNVIAFNQMARLSCEALIEKDGKPSQWQNLSL